MRLEVHQKHIQHMLKASGGHATQLHATLAGATQSPGAVNPADLHPGGLSFGDINPGGLNPGGVNPGAMALQQAPASSQLATETYVAGTSLASSLADAGGPVVSLPSASEHFTSGNAADFGATGWLDSAFPGDSAATDLARQLSEPDWGNLDCPDC